MRKIRFRFSPAKARAALLWMLRQRGRLDLHVALKACYFADKAHLNEHHRPIFGATYRAMRFGPVPLEIYEMAKGEAIWLAELGSDRYPWALDGHAIVLSDNEGPDLSVLSETDLAALENGFALSQQMSFTERTAATHGPDWQAAELGLMRYEDMLEDGADKPAVLDYLQANARFMRL